MKGENSEEEKIKRPKCNRKIHVETVNKETKESISGEEEIGIPKCRRRSISDNMNEEVKGWTSSSKQLEYPPEITKTKEEICVEQMKIKVKRVALEWGNFLLQEQLKSLVYIDRSLRGDTMKDKLIDEFNFKNLFCLSRKKTRKFFVGIVSKKIKFIIHPEVFDANYIISDIFIQNIILKPNMVHDLSRKMKISLKKQILETSV